MLLAVEGGGFFSSSASGYSKGLALLLLGQRNKEKQMRVTPWNQYQLVDHETDPDLQLAPGKNRLVRGCASLKCFGRTAAETESPSPLKVGPTQNKEVVPEPVDIDESKEQGHPVNPIVDGDNNSKIVCLKSSLKKMEKSDAVASTDVDVGGGNSLEHEASCEKNNRAICQMDERKVQWTDTTGGKLFEIREFEMSESGSDDAFDYENGKTCSCRIM